MTKSEVENKFNEENGLYSVNNYNHPFHTIKDKEVPYGKVNKDGIFSINYNTTSRYGYISKPIFAVLIKREATDNIPAYNMYRIFIGECPHKDENGNWTTYNEVPNFLVDSFGGANYIDKEPDIPHVISIETDERRKDDMDCKSDMQDEYNKKVLESNQKIIYCSLKTYLQGLHNRFAKRFGGFSKHIGERTNLYEYCLQNDKHLLRIVWVVEKESDSKYIWIETQNWWRNIHFKKNKKFCLEYEKIENEHCYCDGQKLIIHERTNFND